MTGELKALRGEVSALRVELKQGRAGDWGGCLRLKRLGSQPSGSSSRACDHCRFYCDESEIERNLGASQRTCIALQGRRKITILGVGKFQP